MSTQQVPPNRNTLVIIFGTAAASVVATLVLSTGTLIAIKRHNMYANQFLDVPEITGSQIQEVTLKDYYCHDDPEGWMRIRGSSGKIESKINCNP